MLEDDDAPVPRRGAELPPKDLGYLRTLAASLDCVLPGDMCQLAGVKESTGEAWAKRGEGPPHIMFGNRRLYPRDGLKQFLMDRIHARGPAARTML